MTSKESQQDWGWFAPHVFFPWNPESFVEMPRLWSVLGLGVFWAPTHLLIAGTWSTSGYTISCSGWWVFPTCFMLYDFQHVFWIYFLFSTLHGEMIPLMDSRKDNFKFPCADGAVNHHVMSDCAGKTRGLCSMDAPQTEAGSLFSYEQCKKGNWWFSYLANG